MNLKAILFSFIFLTFTLSCYSQSNQNQARWSDADFDKYLKTLSNRELENLSKEIYKSRRDFMQRLDDKINDLSRLDEAYRLLESNYNNLNNDFFKLRNDNIRVNNLLYEQETIIKSLNNKIESANILINSLKEIISMTQMQNISASAFNSDYLDNTESNQKKVTVQEVINRSSKPVIVYATASWCSLCSDTDLLMDNLKDEYGSRIEFLTIDDNKTDFDFAEKYNLKAYPSVYLFKNGELFYESSGGIEIRREYQDIVRSALRLIPSEYSDNLDNTESNQVNETSVSLTQKISNSSHIDLVYASANWCTACRSVDEIITDINSKYQSEINFHYLEENDLEFVKTYDVKKLPSIYIFNNGKLISNLSGANYSKNEFEDLIKSAIRLRRRN